MCNNLRILTEYSLCPYILHLFVSFIHEYPDYYPMNRKSVWIILFVFVLTLFFKKAGMAFSSVFITISALILGFYILANSFFFDRIYQRIAAFIFLFFSVALLQYWLKQLHFNIFGLQEYSISILIISCWIIFSLLSYQSIKSNILTLSFWLILSIVFTSSVILNPREFHNFYRSNTYEEYNRLRFTEQSGIVADLYIDKYKTVDRERASDILKEAMVSDSLSDYDNALFLYNQSIDLNPDDAKAYYLRGLLKLIHLDLNFSIANSAIKDFNRAIRLDSNYSEAYFHRGLALGYLGLRGRSFFDMKKVWELDSIISDDLFEKRYGSSKKSFSIPFHP